MRILRGLLAASILLAGSTHGQVFDCGTSDERIRHVEELALWGEARRAERPAGGARTFAAPNVEMRGRVVLLPADDINAPFRNPIRLEGRTLTFSRKDSETFVRRNVALEYEDRTGLQPASSTVTALYTLKNFEFPFYEKTVSQIRISPYNAIFPGEAPPTGDEQYTAAELAALRVPVIAPLWATPDAVPVQPAIYIRDTADRLVVTWAVDSASASYDVQATLFRNGDIRFSYKSLGLVRASALVITSASEPWRQRRAEIASVLDAANDVAGTPPATLRPLLDIDSVTAHRIDDSNLLEFRIKVRGTRQQFAAGESAGYYVYIGDPALRQYLAISMSDKGEGTYVSPVWGSKEPALAAWMEEDTVVFRTLQDYLAGVQGTVSIRAYTLGSGASNWSDSVSLSTVIGSGRKSVQTDFRTLTEDETSGPILEAFTLPPLNVGAVWSQIRSAYGYRDDEIDGVAIYQNFLTDLVLYAGAYSTGGNAGARGVKTATTLGPEFPRTPALMHMNKIGYGWNRNDDLAAHVVMHEFGHRWLLSLNIRESGAVTRVLNPASSHPAQYVHTAAPFRVRSERDASVMGGSSFAPNATNTSFTSPPFSNYSYSGLDLYLMGLASPDEVEPWFYIADSSPKLGDAYYPPPESTFSGTRRDVTIQQVIDAMGPRVPAYPGTQRHFRVLFVLVTDPDRPVEESEVEGVTRYASLLESGFAKATGRRAEVATFVAPGGGPRRRSAGR
ncbi:MAG TPA: hypothetical protein VNL91_04120 [Thermoanaerobaculia bacterium]|nr:hypothetical protein [Thermoanaerobaculia bacterium]